MPIEANANTEPLVDLGVTALADRVKDLSKELEELRVTRLGPFVPLAASVPRATSGPSLHNGLGTVDEESVLSVESAGELISRTPI